MKKVKVSKELAIAIEKGMEVSTKEDFLKTHSQNGEWTLDIYSPLNKLSIFELAEILIHGYEVEESSQEIVKKVFNNLPDSEKDIYYKSGILFALNAYGIKIKGINH